MAAIAILICNQAGTSLAAGRVKAAVSVFRSEDIACAYDPSRPSPKLARGLTELVQSAFAEIGQVEWVERDQLDLAEREVQRQLQGFMAPAGSLEIGYWVSADILIRGHMEFVEKEHPERGQVLYLEALDLGRAGKLAEARVQLKKRSREEHERRKREYYKKKENQAIVIHFGEKFYPYSFSMERIDWNALRLASDELINTAVNEYKRWRASLAIAPMFFAPRSDKAAGLAYVGDELLEAFFAKSEESKHFTVLEFGQPGASAEEFFLARSGLIEASEISRKIRELADIYVWGYYDLKNEGSTETNQVALEFTIWAWDGAGNRNSFTLGGRRDQLSDVYQKIVQKVSEISRGPIEKAVNDDERKAIAKFLLDHAEKRLLTPDEQKSAELAQNIREYLLDRADGQLSTPDAQFLAVFSNISSGTSDKTKAVAVKHDLRLIGTAHILFPENADIERELLVHSAAGMSEEQQARAWIRHVDRFGCDFVMPHAKKDHGSSWRTTRVLSMTGWGTCPMMPHTKYDGTTAYIRSLLAFKNKGCPVVMHGSDEIERYESEEREHNTEWSAEYMERMRRLFKEEDATKYVPGIFRYVEMMLDPERGMMDLDLRIEYIQMVLPFIKKWLKQSDWTSDQQRACLSLIIPLVYTVFCEARIPAEAPVCIDKSNLLRNVFQIEEEDHSAKEIPINVPVLPSGGEGALRIGIGNRSRHMDCLMIDLKDAEGKVVASGFVNNDRFKWITHNVRENTTWTVSISKRKGMPRAGGEVQMLVYITPKALPTEQDYIRDHYTR